MAVSIASTAAPPPSLLPDKFATSASPRKHRAKHTMWHRFRFGKWLGREEEEGMSDGLGYGTAPDEVLKPGLTKRLSKRVGVGLPRPPTFKRVNSERRDNLMPIQPHPIERRTASLERRRAASAVRARTKSPPPLPAPRFSAPEFDGVNEAHISFLQDEKNGPEQSEHAYSRQHSADRPPLPDVDADQRPGGLQPEEKDEEDIESEMDRQWILNLSMHFRDKSEREKFFVTYAEKPNRWRRVTVSCDYRSAPPDSLESDLKELHFQRDKSTRIYESIRESLSEIQFYDTVTNLKLETSGGRLHVHVTEDVNEIIPYPPISAVSAVQRLQPNLVRESDLEFDSHLSGFVYKVKLGTEELIKKEIPGPDTVDEFLYEINALRDLSGSESVIQFEGIIVDEEMKVIRGLLIGYAKQGAVVDLLYDLKGDILWKDRQRWAKQIVRGLSEIHEAGYVQGDFTLSNIVVDHKNDARIIDINRRGCPVGWEPPEISAKIKSNQRISMYIGVKSDLYQLGMVLWALAMDEDEPDRQIEPLTMDRAPPEVPDYFKELVRICLSERPRDRKSAKDLLAMFPEDLEAFDARASYQPSESLSSRMTEEQYIDPATAVDREDIARSRAERHSGQTDGAFDVDDSPTFVNPPESRSSDLNFDSSGSYVVARGRSGPSNAAQMTFDSLHNPHIGSEGLEPRIIPISPVNGRRFRQIEVEGVPHLLPSDTISDEDWDALKDYAQQRGLGIINTSGFEPEHDPRSDRGNYRPNLGTDPLQEESSATLASYFAGHHFQSGVAAVSADVPTVEVPLSPNLRPGDLIRADSRSSVAAELEQTPTGSHRCSAHTNSSSAEPIPKFTRALLSSEVETGFTAVSERSTDHQDEAVEKGKQRLNPIQHPKTGENADSYPRTSGEARIIMGKEIPTHLNESNVGLTPVPVLVSAESKSRFMASASSERATSSVGREADDLQLPDQNISTTPPSPWPVASQANIPAAVPFSDSKHNLTDVLSTSPTRSHPLLRAGALHEAPSNSSTPIMTAPQLQDISSPSSAIPTLPKSIPSPLHPSDPILDRITTPSPTTARYSPDLLDEAASSAAPPTTTTAPVPISSMP